MDDDLQAEFTAALEAVKEARTELAKEPVIKGQKGGSRPSPWHYILRDREAHLVRITRLVQSVGAPTERPVAWAIPPGVVAP